jgi:hypothetical protein
MRKTGKLQAKAAFRLRPIVISTLVGILLLTFTISGAQAAELSFFQSIQQFLGFQVQPVESITTTNQMMVAPQAVLYSENFGTTTAYPAGWSSSSTVWTPTTGTTSTGYTGASGNTNVVFNNTGSNAVVHRLTYNNGLSTTGFTNITVLWGARATNTFAQPVFFEWSSDGTTWNSVSYMTVASNAAWALVNGGTRISLPAEAAGVSNLRFRWSITTNNNGTYRIDDFSVEGTPVPVDTTAPTVTINQAADQSDPATSATVRFTVVFSEAVTGFTSADVSLAGSTANVSSATVTVTGSGTTYTVEVSGITSNGTVTASVAAGAAADAANNQSAASTSTDNTVQYFAQTCGGAGFAAKADFGTGSLPFSVTSGDFNKDGNLDLAVANRESDTVSVLLGNGAGDFAPKVDFATGSFPISLTTGDFNKDGSLDLAVANINSNSVSVLLGNGAGGFAAKVDFGTGADPRSVTTGDFNKDGSLDLAVANQSSASVSVLLGNGAGGFAPKVDFATGTGPFSVTTGDFNKDGSLDLAVVNINSNSVSVLLGNGAGGFAPKVDFATGANPVSVTSGDFNKDGNLDLAVANDVSASVSVLIGNGAGDFAPKVDFGAGTTPISVTSGDFNKDGSLDLAVANLNSDSVSVLLGNGAGGFAAKADFGTGAGPRSVTTGDFNKDGSLDLAVANQSSASVSVLLNSCTPDTTAPTVTSIDDGDADDIITTGATLAYTVTFSEDINASTVTATDFNNAGTASITIGAITETTAASGVFTVHVTPTTAGTIILRIPIGAVISDISGNNLAVPVQDDTTVTVNAPDTTAPDTTITGNPTNPTFSTSATFTFTGSDNVGVTGFECQLDGGGFTTCTSPQNYTGLSVGSHTFQVRALDAANNVDQTPASYMWTIDARPTPNTVYVDDDWMTVPTGTDPDDAGPATEMGYDAFFKIQDGVNGVAANGTVNVLAGTYIEDVNVNKQIILHGEGANTTTIFGAKGNAETATVRINASNVDINGFTITRQGNTVAEWNDSTLNGAGVAIQGLSVSGAVIHDNVITGNRTGIDINNSGGHTIRNNVIDFNRTGLIFRNQTDNLTVVENFITNNWTAGVLFLDASGGTNSPVQSAANSVFSNNNISSNWYGQVVDRQTGGSLPAPGTTNLKDFRFNWWGTTTPVVTTANSAEPGYAEQIPTAYGGTATAPGGKPDIAGPASANIKYLPLLATGIDTNVETVPGRGTFGFQGADTTTTISPSNPGGWGFLTETPNGTGSYVEGPGMPPLGSGSARLTVDSTGGQILGKLDYAGTRLDQITELRYSTYQNNNAGSAAIALQLQYDENLNGGSTAFQGRLVYEPTYDTAQTVQQGVWQNWNVLSATAKFWASPNGTSTVDEACPQLTPCTLAQILAAFPNIGIHANPNTGAVIFKVGAGLDYAFDGNVDAFTIGVNNAPSTTFNFEPTPEPPVITYTAFTNTTSTVNRTLTVTITDTGGVPTAGSLVPRIYYRKNNGPAVSSACSLNSGTGQNGMWDCTIDYASLGGIATGDTISYFVIAQDIYGNISSNPSGAVATDVNNVTNPPATPNAYTITAPVAPPQIAKAFSPATIVQNGISTLTITITNPAANTVALTGVGVTDTFPAGMEVDASPTATNSCPTGSTFSPVAAATSISISDVTIPINGTCTFTVKVKGTTPGAKLNTTGAVTSTNGGAGGTASATLTINQPSISGKVTYGTNPAGEPTKFVPGVLVTASGVSPASPASATTDSMGEYLLSNLTSGGEYTVTPTKTDDVNGISPFDATLVLRCVAAGGGCTLTPNQLLVADTNNSGDITPFDATQILRFVAADGQNATTGETGKWKFVPIKRTYASVTNSLTNENYEAYLVGDVNGSWTPPGTPVVPEKDEQTENSSVVLSDAATAIGEQKQQEEAVVGLDEQSEVTTKEESKEESATEVEISLPENIAVQKGSVVSIPVWITNTTGKEISSYTFAVRFDSNVLQPELSAVETADSLSSNGFTVQSDTKTRGRMGIAASSLNNFVSASGTLVYLRFRVLDSTSKSTGEGIVALTFEKTRINKSIFEDEFGNRISSASTNGSLSVAGKSKN